MQQWFTIAFCYIVCGSLVLKNSCEFYVSKISLLVLLIAFFIGFNEIFKSLQKGELLLLQRHRLYVPKVP